MGIWRFAGAFTVVERQSNAGVKLPECTSASQRTYESVLCAVHLIFNQLVVLILLLSSDRC
jgi:hypothetical protein